MSLLEFNKADIKSFSGRSTRTTTAALHRETKSDGDTQHMRHCFDYLRQSLMCASDTTLEPVDATLGGVTGWGNERVCRDYIGVKAWAEERRVSNECGFS